MFGNLGRTRAKPKACGGLPHRLQIPTEPTPQMAPEFHPGAFDLCFSQAFRIGGFGGQRLYASPRCSSPLDLLQKAFMLLYAYADNGRFGRVDLNDVTQ